MTTFIKYSACLLLRCVISNLYSLQPSYKPHHWLNSIQYQHHITPTYRFRHVDLPNLRFSSGIFPHHPYTKFIGNWFLYTPESIISFHFAYNPPCHTFPKISSADANLCGREKQFVRTVPEVLLPSHVCGSVPFRFCRATQNNMLMSLPLWYVVPWKPFLDKFHGFRVVFQPGLNLFCDFWVGLKELIYLDRWCILFELTLSEWVSDVKISDILGQNVFIFLSNTFFGTYRL